jgi:hypothetical protein
MSDRFKFEEVPRSDSLIEEQATEAGQRDYPLRRAVGTPLFENEEDRDDWMMRQATARGDKAEILRLEKIISKRRLKENLSDILEECKGHRPHLERALHDYLARILSAPGETFQADISEDAASFSVRIDSPNHGKLEFKIQ